jgi:hypothetical protein
MVHKPPSGQLHSGRERVRWWGGGEGEISSGTATFPVAERALLAAETSEEFLHGWGSTSRVIRSSSWWKEEGEVRGGASHRR